MAQMQGQAQPFQGQETPQEEAAEWQSMPPGDLQGIVASLDDQQLGELYDIVIQEMQMRQQGGQQGMPPQQGGMPGGAPPGGGGMPPGMPMGKGGMKIKKQMPSYGKGGRMKGKC